MKEFPNAHYSWKISETVSIGGIWVRIFTGEHIYGMFHIIESNNVYGYRDFKYNLVPIDPYGSRWTSMQMTEKTAKDFIRQVLRLPPGAFKQRDLDNFNDMLKDAATMEDVL